MASIPTSTLVVQRFASALYGVQVGTVTMTAVNRDIDNNGLTSTLNSYFDASFGSLTNNAVATLLVANLGITGEAATNAVAYVEGQLAGVANTAKGAVITNILAAFSGLTADATYGAAATAWNNNVDAAAAYTGAANVAVGAIVSNFTLTIGVDAWTGGAGNDTVKGVYGTDGSLSILDTIDGKAGIDTLELIDSNTDSSASATTMPSLLNVTGFEILTVRGGADINVAASTVAFTTVKTTQSVDSTVAANAASDVEVSGATGAIAIDGGKNITVTDSTKDSDITIGATTVAKGAVTVTATKAGATTIAVDGGTDVTVSASGMDVSITTNATDDDITVGMGSAATDLPSGVISVTNAHVGVAGDDVNLNDIAIKGGTTVSVTQTADTSKAATDDSGATLTQGDVSVTGGAKTTSISVVQAAAAAENVAVEAIAAKEGTQKVTFIAAAAGDVITVATDTNNSIVFTAAKALTALEVAQAFANLTKNAATGSASSTSGVYSNGSVGGFSNDWTSGAAVSVTATTASVSFSTSKDLNGATAGLGLTSSNDLSVSHTRSGSAVTGIAAATVVDGNVATLAETGVLGVTAGKVVVDGDITGTDVLTTVTLNAYGDASTVKSGVLTTLNLSNADEDVTVTTASTGSVTLNLNKVAGANAAVSLDGGSSATVTGVTINATGTKSDLAVTAAAATTVTVNAAVDIDLTASVFSAATKMVVTGTGKVILDGDHSTSVLAAVDASAATGTVDASGVALTAAGVYTGGAGADTFTVTASATKASTGGSGNDVITVSSFGTGGSVDAGEGTDTLVMTAENAATASASSAAALAFNTAATNFEKLSLKAVVADGTPTNTTVTVDLSKLAYTSVVSAGSTDTGSTDIDTLALTNAASGVTLEITAAGAFNVGVKDASTGTADVVNIVTNQDGNLSVGTVTIANVETVNITADDKVVDTSGAYDEFGNGIADGKDDNNSAQSISLTADTAATVNVAGSADVTLDLVSSSVVTAVNASTMTGKFELVADGKSTGTTVTGGSGVDTLTAYGSNDVLIGGAGNDKLTATSLTTLTGGAGNDTFVLPTVVAATEYSTITDLSAGDVIDTAATTFATSKIVLASNSTFAQYLDAAVNAASSVTSSVGSAVNGQWFQFNGDTFLVIDGYTDDTADTDASGYLATEDSVIAITGLVNLSTAVFNATTGDLTIV